MHAISWPRYCYLQIHFPTHKYSAASNWDNISSTRSPHPVFPVSAVSPGHNPVHTHQIDPHPDSRTALSSALVAAAAAVVAAVLESLSS